MNGIQEITTNPYFGVNDLSFKMTFLFLIIRRLGMSKDQ